MPSMRVLYISGSVGLGHARRDLAIARELRRLDPGVEIAWLAGDPARQVIAEAGEMLLAEEVVGQLGREASWPPIPTDGSCRAAGLINQLLDAHPSGLERGARHVSRYQRIFDRLEISKQASRRGGNLHRLPS
jgi:hypothetical protein